ncbi:MAG: outer membrane protein assembly factor BamE [Candidatus Binatia bacterium]|nr:outer membrane protein assembly factor BamE [Candidatus Binatia bacterium]
MLLRSSAVSGVVIGFVFFLSVGGCVYRREEPVGEHELTLGRVQKEIHVGLSQADVAERLGSPNIVTRDATGQETWIYDKMAAEASYSRSGVFGTVLLVTVGGASGSVRTSQRTLTVVIKFDDSGRVESFSYHASRF